jgi:Nucleotidyltransferase domain
METVHAVLRELGSRLEALGVTDALRVGGSLATGDYVPGVSDLDLVAVTRSDHFV